MGFLMSPTPAIAPAFKSHPCIMDASSSLCPSCAKTAPLPALNRGQSSKKLMVFSMASMQVPPLAKIVSPMLNASFSFSRYSFCCTSLISRLLAFPAPPCITITYSGLVVVSACWHPLLKINILKMNVKIGVINVFIE